jgi:hypothetical protein
MSDTAYFVCLGITMISAIAVPVACWRTLAAASRSMTPAMVAGVGAVLGFVCALPFSRTQELPWLPYVAAVYFGGMVIGVVLYGVSRRGDAVAHAGK